MQANSDQTPNSRLRLGLPPIHMARMVIWQPAATLLVIQVLAISSSFHFIILLEQSSFPQLWQQEFNNIIERAGSDRIRLWSISQSLHVGHTLEGRRIRTKLKPSTSASSTHLWNSSATCSGVPTAVAPRPPTLTISATVCLVHLATPGVALDHPSTADLARYD